ncbi:hypothetical protein ACWEQ3_47485 [Streptomyces mirabilis]
MIDATLDNDISVEGQDGDPNQTVELAISIRHAGWAALPDWPEDAAELESWVRPGQIVTMALTGPQWNLIVTALDRWAAVAGSRGTSEGAEKAREIRAIAEQLRQHLAHQR